MYKFGFGKIRKVPFILGCVLMILLGYALKTGIIAPRGTFAVNENPLAYWIFFIVELLLAVFCLLVAFIQEKEETEELKHKK